jgi:hypothetical protein
MSLRTFLNNPSLGGFGNETNIISDQTEKNRSKSSLKRKRSRATNEGQGNQVEFSQPVLTDKTNQLTNPNKVCHNVTEDHQNDFGCDAFAQIIKELVDNAVDACNVSTGHDGTQLYTSMEMKDEFILKRVRVSISETQTENATILENQLFDEESRKLLRVTVSDNGCGMEDIEMCVNAFQSTKNSASSDIWAQHSGRYGIGLTLCLLHAQRLVPFSCPSIMSTTVSAASWTKLSVKVDADNDQVLCSNIQYIPKKNGEEDCSGTEISLLLPVSHSLYF